MAADKQKSLKFGGPPSEKVKQYRQVPVYTSESHPIYVDWMAPTFDAKNGNIIAEDEKQDVASLMRIDFKLGMTLCPGKHQGFAASNCEWQRDLGTDLKALKDAKVDDVVSLLSAGDLKRLKVPQLVEAVGKHRMKAHWVDIADGTTPKDVEEWKQVVQQVARRLSVDKKVVVVHCMGGLKLSFHI